jgi:hypothetical protein
VRTRKTSPSKGSPKNRKSTSKSPSKKTSSPTRTQTTHMSSSNYTPTSSVRSTKGVSPSKLNKDLQTPSSLPDFHPSKYGSVAVYKDSQEH